MMLAAQQLAADGSVRAITITGTAQSSGLLLEIPAADNGPPMRLVVTWAAVRVAAPQAIGELGPHLAAPKPKPPRERPSAPAPQFQTLPTPPAPPDAPPTIGGTP